MTRQLPQNINWEWRLNGLVGARGTGKTTRLLQQGRHWQQQGHKVLYATLDDFHFSQQRPYEVALAFSQMGGRYLLFDEVHKYAGWSTELKNIYDLLPELVVAFSGSSVIQLHEQDADLSRRALLYHMPGLSFREYLQLMHNMVIPAISLADLMQQHAQWTLDAVQSFRPLAYWPEYVRQGYFPFAAEANRNYLLTLEQMINYVLDVDFQYISGYQPGHSQKLQAIMRIIAQAPPFKPNVSKMAEQIGITRNTLVNYLHYLHQALLTCNVFFPGSSISHLQKPEKVALANPNFYYLLAGNQPDKGSLREAALLSLVMPHHSVHLHPQADFLINDHWVLEIGGRHKPQKQIAGLENARIVKDDIETGQGNQIPLWAFGCLY